MMGVKAVTQSHRAANTRSKKDVSRMISDDDDKTPSNEGEVSSPPNKAGATPPSDNTNGLSKDDFARRLWSLTLKKGWRQSELARQAGVPRGSISQYVNAKALPTPQYLAKLAKALGVDESLLMPNYAARSPVPEPASFEMRALPSDGGKVKLIVNRVVSLTTGIKVGQLLQDDTASD